MKRTLLLALCFLLLVGCAGQPQTAPATEFKLPASVQVVLNVLTPQGSPTGEPVQLNIVDTVTGISFNSETINMQPSGTGSFAATLSVPPGTLLTYRFTRLSVSGSVDEVSASGQPLLYRTFLVTGAGHVVHDLIAAWADQPSQLTTGQVAGQVTATSGEPLAGILLRASGLQAVTDAEGNFFFDGLTQGLHNIVVTDPTGRHQSFQQGALVAANSQTPASIQLQAAEMAQVTFIVLPHASNPSGVPVYLLGNLGAMAGQPVLSAHDGGYSLTLELPTGTDLRYKYTLGDGLWNAEHYTDGNFVLRQLIIPAGTTQLTVRDNLQEWSAGGGSGPIWFDLTAPDDGSPVYLQFKLLDWATALPMWNLGGGRHAYVLYSPTNFAEPLEYRYCRDAACTQPEVQTGTRSVVGNQPNTQQVQDSVTEWQSQP
ncbi:MAG: hypothetical protein KIT08_10265 [Anaerolineales bacterium]|nr:MAG: hypothetical protein KIT08_10265 [Anaerolineales bacterium]